MEILLLIIVVVSLIGNIALIYISLQKKEGQSSQDAQQLMLQQINNLRETVDSKIGESQKSMTEAVTTQFSQSQQLIRQINQEVTKHLMDVTREVSETKEASKQVFTITQSLQNLEKVLKNQKQRGNLGEAGLELILNNMLPPSMFDLQYLFPNGEQVDAVIHTKDGVIPVDAKFSLDNYQRFIEEEDEIRKAVIEKEFVADIKKRIDETSKYVREKDNTLPFAFMYIPAEGIYYDLIVNKVGSNKSSERSLIDYALDKKVVIVSPTTFSAYLNSVLYGFKAFKIEEKALDIQKHVSALQKHLQTYEEYHTKLGNTLGTAINHYNSTTKEFKKIDKDVVRIGSEATVIDSPLLAKPEED
jgi:DNA recombination protein RmuC